MYPKFLSLKNRSQRPPFMYQHLFGTKFQNLGNALSLAILSYHIFLYSLKSGKSRLFAS